MHKICRLTFLLSIFLIHQISPQGHVYLVIGSDTAIWDGMNTSEFNCTYNDALFTNTSMNGYKVMDPLFRNQMKDSYGNPMKMTWWMMAGNIFRYAANTNVPLGNTITLYSMKKHHSDQIQMFGDEVSLHYHTFVWSDYNGDNQYWWNQAKSFLECTDDFKVTLAQFLLEENTFPVSFRSGWHYMDNEWQSFLDELVPYSLHNDYPNIQESTQEPIDNVYDWSKASKEFFPYHPSKSNYQLNGDGKSWNTRSRFMGSISQSMMDDIFAKASKGVDQVPCFWAHLPESNFLENMKRIDSLTHISAAKYPAVKFSYCTAVEAMQKWRKGNDTTAPVIILEEVISGSGVKFQINSNETIFQLQPFIAAKNIYEEYIVLDCIRLNETSWITKEPLPKATLAKVGVAITDTMGNLSTEFINYLPDDIYIDNGDSEYREEKGTWLTSSVRSWGNDSRQCILGENDTVMVKWSPNLKQPGLYNLFLQQPSIKNPTGNIYFKILAGGIVKDTFHSEQSFSPYVWNYLGTINLQPGDEIQMLAYGKNQAGRTFIADVLKLSALVKDHVIIIKDKLFQSAMVSERDTVVFPLRIQNQGIKDLQIKSIYSKNGFLTSGSDLPLMISGMKTETIPVLFYAEKSGFVLDTLFILSNDPIKPIISVTFNVEVTKYFTISDNEDSENYLEGGPWSTSNAQAWGSSSRYCWAGNNGYAKFKFHMKYPGKYEISFIVPATSNAVQNALYIIKEGIDTITTVITDQNVGSGTWVSLGSFYFKGTEPVEITVRETGTIVQNKVLRTDAIKCQLLNIVSAGNQINTISENFHLMQNYPNPFNSETIIRYYLEKRSSVKIEIFNSLGQSVSQIEKQDAPAGEYNFNFNAGTLSSGIYFYSIRIKAEDDQEFRDVKKMILLR